MEMFFVTGSVEGDVKVREWLGDDIDLIELILSMILRVRESD